jgi:hypothetical protein
MDEGLHCCKFQAQKIEHTNRNKVTCKLLCFDFLPFFIVLNICMPKCFFLISKIQLCNFATGLSSCFCVCHNVLDTSKCKCTLVSH